MPTEDRFKPHKQAWHGLRRYYVRGSTDLFRQPRTWVGSIFTKASSLYAKAGTSMSLAVRELLTSMARKPARTLEVLEAYKKPLSQVDLDTLKTAFNDTQTNVKRVAARENKRPSVQLAAWRGEKPPSAGRDRIAGLGIKTPRVSAKRGASDSVAIEKIKSRLKPDELELLRLRYIEGLTLEEIGRTLELPPDTVQKRIRAILNRLKRHYLDDSGAG